MKKMVTLGCLIILLVSMAVLTSATIGSSSELLAEKPIWHVGDSWTFQRLRGCNFAYYFTLTVVDVRANFDKRKKCYKVQYESFDREWKIYEQYRSFWYFTEDLIYLGLERKDGTIEKPFKIYSNEDNGKVPFLYVKWNKQSGRKSEILMNDVSGEVDFSIDI